MGDVPITVQSRARGHAHKWNRALYLPVDASKELQSLRERTEKLLYAVARRDDGEKESQLSWSTTSDPHVSLYYGPPLPQELIDACDGPEYSFDASTVSVWVTNPSSVKGVAQWHELTTWNLSR